MTGAAVVVYGGEPFEVRPLGGGITEGECARCEDGDAVGVLADASGSYPACAACLDEVCEGVGE